jgi:hypothetical protein
MSAKATTTVTLVTRDGPRQVEAEAYGLWAVHQSAGERLRGEWWVTHIPSGRAVVGRHGISKAKARKYARALAKECHGPEFGHADPLLVAVDRVRLIYNEHRRTW